MTVRLLSTLAVMGAVRALAPLLDACGLAVESSFAPTLALLDRLRAGEVADAAILTDAGIAALTDEGVVRPGSRIDIAVSQVGLAVRAGAPKPDISSVAALTQTLLAADGIAYSRIGASGIFFAGLIERLGIADAVNARATIVPAGFTAELAARGEVTLAVQQVSELLVVDGIDLVGRLPAELQSPALFSGGVLTGAADPARAAALLTLLASPDAAPALRQSGLDPIDGA